MKKYYIQNDGVIYAEPPRQFVTELRLGSWFDSECTDEEYIANFSGRYRISSSVDMKYSSAEEFLNILIETGFVERIEDVKPQITGLLKRKARHMNGRAFCFLNAF